jgi:DNA-binding winged helix-turn-helix (wHTH) protein/tetratricopeptide (TPR) repeat protein
MPNYGAAKKSSEGPNAGAGNRIVFLDFIADPQTGELFRGGRKLRVQRKTFDLLLVLLRRPGEVVTRKEICRTLWPDSILAQANVSLNTAMRKLRATLGEVSDHGEIIETVGSRGYRLLVRPTLQTGRSIRLAVLPFENSSSDNSDHFAEWLTEEMIVQLADMQPDVTVVVPVPAGYKLPASGDLCDKVRELDPDYVLGGDVVRTEHSVRVTAILVRGRDCAEVWSQTFARELAEPFSVQDDIASLICSCLRQALPLARKESSESESAAYDKIAKGNHFAGQWDEASFARAVEFFDQAIKEEPGFARAHAALARTYASMLQYGTDRPTSVQEKLRASASTALDLCPENPKALVALGCAEMFYDANLARAEEYFRHAIRVSPAFAYTYECYTRLLIATGRVEESIAAARRARELQPTSPYSNLVVGAALFFARRFEDALGPVTECIEMAPGFAMARAVLGRAYEGLGRFEEAVASFRTAVRCAPQSTIMLANLAHGLAMAGHKDEASALVDQLLAMRESSYVPAYWIALAHLALGEETKAMDWLLTAVRDRDAWRLMCAVDPALDALRGSREFRGILKQIGFIQVD